MNKDKISLLCGLETITIVEAMALIDANAMGILFIVDDEGVLKGTLTDGDIRRWLLKTGNLKACVKSAMKCTPKYLYEKDKNQADEFLINEGINALPILDENNIILDIVIRNDNSYKKEQKKANLSDISVVIMAGGKGTRLYPYTRILPKPLIPIGDTPIVERIINSFADYGIIDFHMTVNYKKSMLKSYFAEIEHGYNINFVEENVPLGTGGSIKLINKCFKQPLFVTNCDSLILADFSDVYDYHVKSGNSITIVSALKNTQIPYGVLHSGGNGELVEIDEKPKMSYFINTGVYIINPETIDLIPEDTFFHMTHLVEKVMNSGGKVGMYPVSEDSFLDMGEFREMKRMEEKLNIISEF